MTLEAVTTTGTKVMVTASYAGNLLTIYNPFCLKQPEMIILTVHILELYLYVCVITYSRSTYTQSDII